METKECKLKTSIPKEHWFVSWKLFYAQLTQGRSIIDSSLLEKELSNNKSQLLQGFGFRERNSNLEQFVSGWALPYEDVVTQEKKKKLNESSLTISKLSNILNLEEDVCEKILISFFEHEFVGTSDDVSDLLSSTSQDQEKLVDIVLYFIHEKSFFMKCWKIILTHAFDQDHMYHDICNKFVQDQDPSNLYTFFIKQLELNQENGLPPETHPQSEVFKTWVNQTFNFQVDIISCLMYVLDVKPSISFKDVRYFLSCCKETSFGINILNVQFIQSTYTNDWRASVGYMYCLHLVQLLLDSNSDWNHNQFNELFDDIKSLDIDQNPVLVPVISLAWILFLIRINYIPDEEKLLKYSQRAFQLKPWEQLSIILNSEVLKVDKILENLVIQKVSTLVCEIIKHLDMNVLEFENQELFKLISRFSKHDDVIQSEEIQKVISFGLDMFPGKHLSILHLYISLMNKSEADCNLCLNELLSGKYFNWRSVDVPMTNRDGAFFSACSFCPFEYAQDVVIPEGTLCQQSESGFDYFQWEINIPLWSILKEELVAYSLALSDGSGFPEDDVTRNTSYLCNSAHGKVPHQKYLCPLQDNTFRSRILTYLRLIAALVKYPSLLDENITEILTLVSQLFELNTTGARQHTPDVEIITLCIDISRNMYPGVTMLYSQILHILPKVLATPDVENAHEILATGRFLDGNSLRRILKNGEMSKVKVEFVKAYLEFLKKISEQEASIGNVAYIHGVLFVTLELFPACLTSWLFQHEEQRRQICLSCLTLITNFLNTYNPDTHQSEPVTSADNLVPPSFTRIVRAVVHSILDAACGDLLLEITSLGETFLLNAFLESPSSSVQLPLIIEIVYFALVVLNKVLYLKKEMFTRKKKLNEENSLLEVGLQKPRFIQSVISLFHHSLRRSLRFLSISVLRRILENRDINLNVSSEQARVLWLQPLCSHTENAQLKISLLQLCVQCLETQATLSCMLLDVENAESNSSLLHFLLNYLKNVNDVNNPLHYWVLAILHTIWKKEMFIVRSKITHDSQFWSYISEALHKSPSCANDCYVFSPVFNIVSTELYWMSNDKEHPLFDFVDKFFANEANLREWSETCTSVEQSGEKFGLFHQLSISWQEFIVVVCKFRPSALSEKVKNILISDVLNALVQHLACIDSRSDIKHSFYALNSLGLILLNTGLGVVSLEDNDMKVNSACQTIVLLAKNYDCVPVQSQILFLAFVSKLFNIICKESLNSVTEFPGFLNALGIVLRNSLDIYENVLADRTLSKNTQLISVIIPLTIQIQSILGNQSSAWISTLLHHNIFFKVNQCILESVKMKFYNDTSSLFLQYLIHCVLGDYYNYLDKVSLLSVIEEMAPQSNIRETDKNYILLNSYNISYVYTNEEYNMFYSKIINLLMVLLHRCDHSLKRQVFNFIIVNYESFVCLFKYAGLAMTKRNLNFVLSCLNLILEMSNYRILIEEHTSKYFIKIVQNICICMKTTVDLLEKKDLKIAHKIYPQEAFDEGLDSKVYNSKLKTPEEKVAYCNELRAILLNIYQTCLTVYNKYNVEFGLVLTCARVGYLPWAIHNIVPHVSVEQKLEPEIPFCDFTIIIRCLKVHMELLGSQKDNETLLNKIRSSFEMTLHLLVNHSLMYLLNPYNNVQEKHVLLRDIELNLAYIIDYVKKNNGVTILPFTKHWSKSPRKYFAQKQLKVPKIKLKLRKEQHVLTWGDANQKKQCIERLFTEGETDERVSSEVQPDIEYMQFMVQLFSQICSLASDTM